MFSNIFIFDIQSIIFSYLDIDTDEYLLDICSDIKKDYIYKYWLKNCKYKIFYNSNHFVFTLNNNIIHRDFDNPAIIYYNGTKCWYKNNLLHRDNNLPAIIYNDGRKEWYIEGMKINYNENEIINDKLLVIGIGLCYILLTLFIIIIVVYNI